MQTNPRIVRTLITVAFVSTACPASAGIMSYLPLSGDADSGITPALTYTAKAGFLAAAPMSSMASASSTPASLARATHFPGRRVRLLAATQT